MIGKEEVPPEMLGGVEAPRAREDHPWSSEETGMDLRALHRHGWSISALARRFQINRRTVAREVAADGPRAYPPRAPKHTLTPAQLAHIERRLLVCPVLRATDLHRELQRDFGYNGSYPTFGRQLRELRPAPVVEAEVRFESAAGVQRWTGNTSGSGRSVRRWSSCTRWWPYSVTAASRQSALPTAARARSRSSACSAAWTTSAA